MSRRDFRQIYFYELNLRRTSSQTARSINEVWATEASTNALYNVDSRSFVPAPPTSRTSHMAAVDNDPLKAPVEADPRKTTQDVAEDLDVDRTTVVRHFMQIGKTKKRN